jgi:hypothetical protein
MSDPVLEKRDNHCFISYATEDGALAQRIAKLRVWKLHCTLFQLAKKLKKRQHFDYARRLFALASKIEIPDPVLQLKIVQQYASCTEKAFAERPLEERGGRKLWRLSKSGRKPLGSPGRSRSAGGRLMPSRSTCSAHSHFMKRDSSLALSSTENVYPIKAIPASTPNFASVLLKPR